MKFMMWFLGVFILATSPAWGGAGSRGGQIEDVDSTPTLVDLVTKAVCNPVSGKEVVAAHPYFENHIIASLRKLDWYFANDVLAEAKTLDYCFTGPLYRELPYDEGSPVKPPSQKGVRQLGYRLNQMVYFDNDLFYAPKMTDYMQSHAIFHEVVQSYFPMWVFNRAYFLKSFVKITSQIDSGQISSPQKLHYAMRVFSVNFPTTVERLQSSRSALEFLLAFTEDQESAVTQLPEIDSILDFPSEKIGLLARWDRETLLEKSPHGILARAFSERLVNDSVDEFKALLVDKRFQRISPWQLALAISERLSPEKKAVLFSGDLRAEIYNSFLATMKSAKLSRQQDGRAVLDPAVAEELGVETGRPTAILDIPLPTTLPTQFKCLANLMIYLVNHGEWDLVNNLAGPDSPFTQAIGLRGIHEAVAGFSYQYANERPFSERRTTLISNDLKELFAMYLGDNLSQENYLKVMALIFPSAQK